MIEENYVLAQRIVRGGFYSEAELFEHYAKISGKPSNEIKEKFGCRDELRSLFSMKYYSGGHGVIEQRQKMHLGLTPAPNQVLQTMKIGDTGRRKTGYDIEKDSVAENAKTCLFLGGSALLGIGATSDRETIAGRVGLYLNNEPNISSEFRVVNNAMLGFNSLQELISLLQSEIKPDYVVALSGWNEIDQTNYSQSKVASLAQACDARANSSTEKKILNNFLQRAVTFQVLKRFIVAFIAYDDVLFEKLDSDTINIYPLF